MIIETATSRIQRRVQQNVTPVQPQVSSNNLRCFRKIAKKLYITVTVTSF